MKLVLLVVAIYSLIIHQSIQIKEANASPIIKSIPTKPSLQLKAQDDGGQTTGNIVPTFTQTVYRPHPSYLLQDNYNRVKLPEIR